MGSLTKAFQGLLALAVSLIAVGIRHRLVLAVAQMLGHLSIKRALDQQLGQLIDQSMLANQVFRLSVIRQQAIQQLRRYSVASSLRSSLLLVTRQFPASRPFTQNLEHAPLHAYPA